jgi:Fic family protein
MVLVWEPIADLPQDWSALTDGELGPLLQFWNDQRKDLEQSGVLASFNQRLAREWSIETGQIEGVYQLDRGITQTLIEKGINADLIPSQPGQKPPELIVAIIQDHADVLEGLFQFVKGERSISKGYIHELHAALLRHQDTTMMVDQFGNLFESKLLKGKYKERPNNPKKLDGSIHQYAPPEQVDPEMERLLRMHAEHEKKGVPVEVRAAWLHHRFTQIHPYQDGNGRVARALASLLFVKQGWFPIVVTRDDRPRYIDALEVADDGDLRSLIPFFTYLQKRALFEAVQSVAEVRGVHSVDEAITAVKNALKSLGKHAEPAIWLKTKETADRLISIAGAKLEELAANLTKEIAETGTDFSFSKQDYVLLRLNDLPYKPNWTDYEQGRGLHIDRSSRSGFSVIEVQAHCVGSKFRGLIAFATGLSDDSGKTTVVSKEGFQVNYAESSESAERRFRPWLEESLVNALTMWRKSL